MISVEDYFTVEEIYILNPYFDEMNKERLIRKLEANKERIGDKFLKVELQSIIDKTKSLNDFEFKMCMESLPYEEFQTAEEIEKEKEQLLLREKQKAFMDEYGIVDEGEIVDKEDLHEYMEIDE